MVSIRLYHIHSFILDFDYGLDFTEVKLLPVTLLFKFKLALVTDVLFVGLLRLLVSELDKLEAIVASPAVAHSSSILPLGSPTYTKPADEFIACFNGEATRQNSEPFNRYYSRARGLGSLL